MSRLQKIYDTDNLKLVVLTESNYLAYYNQALNALLDYETREYLKFNAELNVDYKYPTKEQIFELMYIDAKVSAKFYRKSIAAILSDLGPAVTANINTLFMEEDNTGVSNKEKIITLLLTNT